MNNAQPFLKWPGGKRWLVKFIKELVGDIEYSRYLEPFLGGGAVFFGLSPERALLSDINEELITTYIEVRDRPEQVVEKLKAKQVNKKTYLSIRREKPTNSLDTAVRLLYLNRTAFGGMYRLNQQGEFNVPFGGGERTPAILWEQDLIAQASNRLQKAKIISGDFITMLAKVGAGDLVYCDPTYTVAHNNNSFIRYNERNFSWKDQVCLAKKCRIAAKRGATVLVSNAYHKEVAALYTDAEQHIVKRMSLLSPIPSNRRETREYLFIFHPT